jgi:hypothetical protein
MRSIYGVFIFIWFWPTLHEGVPSLAASPCLLTCRRDRRAVCSSRCYCGRRRRPAQLLPCDTLPSHIYGRERAALLSRNQPVTFTDCHQWAAAQQVCRMCPVDSRFVDCAQWAAVQTVSIRQQASRLHPAGCWTRQLCRLLLDVRRICFK